MIMSHSLTKRVSTGLSLLAVGFLQSVVVSAVAQTSSLWGTNGELWSASGRLQDYSWAGYRSSAVPIPNVPVVATLSVTNKPNGTNDISAALQNLINTVPTPGAIFIPSGRWYINNRVYLNRSGVVLRGEAGTELYEPQSLSEIDGVDPTTTQLYSNGHGFIVAGGSKPTTQVATITANAPKGATNLTITATGSLAVGDLIQITQTDPTNRSLAFFLHGDLNECGLDTYANSSAYPQMFESFRAVQQKL